MTSLDQYLIDKYRGSEKRYLCHLAHPLTIKPEIQAQGANMLHMTRSPANFQNQIGQQLQELGIHITRHGLDCMWNRRIDHDMVGETCLFPEKTTRDPDGKPTIKLLTRQFGDRTLRLIVDYANAKKSIVSVSWKGYASAMAGKVRI